MNVFMRSELALQIGVALYIIVEFFAVPIVSFLTMKKKVNDVIRNSTLLVSFALAVATPLLIATPFESQFLHISNEHYYLYLSSLFFVLMLIPFVITLTIDLYALDQLKNKKSQLHSQARYFQYGSMIVFVIQALLLLTGAATFCLLVSIYSAINPPEEIRAMTKVAMLISLIPFPFVFVRVWGKLVVLISNHGEN